MLRNALILLSLSLLASCVTEKSYIDADNQVKNLDFDRNEAAKSRLLLGLAYLRNQNFPKAKFNLEKALEYAPNRADVHYSLAYYYQTVDELELAEQAYRQALIIEPNNPDTLNNLAVFLCEIGDYEEAIKGFEKALAVPSYSQIAKTYLNMAYCAMDSAQFERALDYLITANKHDPQSPDVQLSLSSLYYANDDLDNASLWHQSYMSQNKPDANAMLLGILIEQKLKHVEQYELIKGELLSLYPDSEEAILINANMLMLSHFEKLRKKVQNLPLVAQHIEKSDLQDSELANLQPNTASPMTTEPEVVTKTGIHTLYSLEQNNVIPEEVIAHEDNTQQQYEIIERTPILEISTPKVKIPVHKVGEGENLYRVSVKYNIQIATLIKWNNLKKPQVNAGKLLYIGNPDVYYVADKNKKLSVIANELKVDFEQLKTWNNIEIDGLVKAGTKILKVDVEQF